MNKLVHKSKESLISTKGTTSGSHHYSDIVDKNVNYMNSNFNENSESSSSRKDFAMDHQKVLNALVPNNGTKTGPSKILPPSFPFGGMKKNGHSTESECVLKEKSLLEMGFNTHEAEGWKNVQPPKENLYKLLKDMVDTHTKTNVQIRIGDIIINCHLMVLQCYSDLFMEFNNEILIQLPEEKVTPGAFMMVYDWMLAEEPLVQRERILELFKAANFLRIPELIKQCWFCLGDEECFREDTAFLLYLEAKKYELEVLEQLMLMRVCKFFLTLVASKEFLDLSAKELCTLLNSNMIGVNSEIEIFMTAVRWLSHDWEEREQNLLDISNCVRFTLIPSWFLVTLIKNANCKEVDRIVSHPEVNKMINNGISYVASQMHYGENRDEFLQFLDRLQLVSPKQRQWIYDKQCSYHHRIACPNMEYVTYKTFLDYLEQIRNVGKDYWRSVEMVKDVGKPIQCCIRADCRKSMYICDQTVVGTLLRALNDAFTLIADSLEVGEVQNFQVVKPMNSKPPVFRDLQLIHDFVQKTALLCLVAYPGDEYYGLIDISKFRALKRLELKKIDIKQVVGIQRLRAQLQHVICVKSIKAVDDIITNCGGDKSNGFVWNELKIADFSYNNLKRVDTSLEFAQYLQHLNLRHNQLQSVEAVKWLPNLKTLDVSFNRLFQIPQFHMDACKRLQSLNMSNNLLEDIRGIVKLDAITDLDLSDNFLLDHTYLLPLRALMTLKFLNLYGNPLHCHPKHRLATAKYLHKNCSTVQFVLDFDILSKNEKAVTGTDQQLQTRAFNRYTMRSSSSSISARTRRSTATATPSSSVGSLVSFTLPTDNSSDSSEYNNTEANVKQKTKSSKTRCVEIQDHPVVGDEENAHAHAHVAEDVMNSSITSISTDGVDTEHLETKRQIVELREKYGNEWLHTGNAEMRQSFMGNLPSSATIDIDLERQKSREMFKEFIKDVTENSASSNNETTMSSTPTNNTLDNTLPQLVASPIRKLQQSPNSDSSLYKSFDQSQTLTKNTSTKVDTETTLYKSMDESKKVNNSNPFEDSEDDEGVEKDIPETSESEHEEVGDHLKYVYSSTENDEAEFSEREDDEETYIVYNSNHNEAIFLTKSSNFLRERDPLTEKTKAKWSLKILESCDRIKSNTLRINFDTVKVDKQERVYTVEEDLCQELENKLRDVLSQRDLTEMNQAIYRCVNCNCQFSQEIKQKNSNLKIRCPNCKSSFIAEIHDIPKSLEKAVGLAEKLSPAYIVEELPSSEIADDSNSIGKGKLRLSAINPLQQVTTTPKQFIKRSATSLNESSCSKITSNSDSSFNSNQSLVGSSNTDRDLDFKTNGESDIDIISNPSQSSIEVLEQFSSRKTSEERRISQIPNLATIDDQSYTQTFLEREIDNMIKYAKKDNPEDYLETEQNQPQAELQEDAKKSSKSSFAHNNLTESSSSGSVTDSVCTAYEQKDGLTPKIEIKSVTKDFLQKETNDNVTNTTTKKEEGNSGLTSMFGALMQSTNILMSSSKKLIDSETFSNVKSGTVIHPTPAATPNPSSTTTSPNSSSPPLYKFNYSDFNDVDHRLKLYFYQTKFEDKDEHFKWIVKGRIYIESTKQLSVGCVVVSTCKLYVMEAFAEENDDVSKWLRPITSCTVDRLDTIQLLPWKMGLSFYLRGWGGFLLLLQDILRTDSLMLFFANNALPSPCELIYQPNEVLTKRLNSSVMDEQLHMCAILNGCEISCENAKRSFSTCCLLTTDSRLYLSSQKLGWLSAGYEQRHNESAVGDDIELCVTQFMSNLVEVEHCSDCVFIINFLDETQDKCELWKCTFETAENASTCLNAIAQSWEKLFGVPLINA